MVRNLASRADIRLSQIQLDLVKTLKAINKPIIVILFNGRPLDLHGVLDEADAILESWFPGTEGGAAIADLLFGNRNPSGKLSMSFPYSIGQIPVYYNHFHTGRPKNELHTGEKYVSGYLDIPNEPLFPFGFGLSYTTFSYKNAKLSNETIEVDTSITISVDITNTGDVKGEEIVQLYIQDVIGEVVRPIKELKGFERLNCLDQGKQRPSHLRLQRNSYAIIIVIYNIKVIGVHLLLILVRTVRMFKLYLFI